MGAYVLNTYEIKPWKTILNQCECHDVYHLPEYHLLAEKPNKVQGKLFVFEVDRHVIAMPILLRRIIGEAWDDTTNYYDVTSVYGYPGPVSNNSNLSGKIIDDFWDIFQNYLRKENVVSIFSRLNPLFNQGLLLNNTGEILDIGPTAAIDLTLPVDVQKRHYRTDHRYRINKAKREGVVCKHDEELNYFDDFIEIYNQTMQRVDAADYYFFGRNYFYRMQDLLGQHLQLFVAFKGKTAISAALFTSCNSIIQYHLSGTRSEYLELSPNRIILDAVRLWGVDIGASVFHLGGGVGGEKDGLFRFKAGFSNQVYHFKVWRKIVDKEAYQQLIKQKRAWNRKHELKVIDEDYFPYYRALTEKMEK